MIIIYYYQLLLFIFIFIIFFVIFIIIIQLQQQHKAQEILFSEKDTAVNETSMFRDKLISKETEIQRETKRRQKTHLELMEVR